MIKENKLRIRVVHCLFFFFFFLVRCYVNLAVSVSTDLHGDEIKEKSINMSAQDLSILLCHERSHACLGLVPKHKKEKVYVMQTIIKLATR